MSLVFLGTRANTSTTSNKHRYYISILIQENDTKILYDYGKGFTRDIWLKYNPDYLIISHVHPDHIAGLENLKEGDLDNTLIIGTRQVKQWIIDHNIPIKKFKEIKRKSRFKLDNIKIETYPVEHSTVAPNILTKIYLKDKTIAIATDFLYARNIEDIVRDVDIWIGDGASISRDIVHRKNKIGHMSIAHQLDICSKLKIPVAIFSSGDEIITMDEQELQETLDMLSKGVHVIIPSDGDKMKNPKRN